MDLKKLNLKVAIVHEWLIDYSGSERVLEQMLNVFPDADLFSIIDFLPENLRFFIKDKKVKTTFIQKMPFAEKKYKYYLPLMPIAIEQLDVSKYDLVISSSHAISKGVLTSPNQLHICMCYSPMRYIWDLQNQYIQENNLDSGLNSIFIKYVFHKMRIWDSRTSNGVDKFIAISKFISNRIWKVYKRESKIIYPPVDVDKFEFYSKKEDFYLTASRLVPYKKVSLIVDAFSQMPDKKLVVIGDGSEFNKIKSKAGKNIELLGYQSFEILLKYMQRSKCFIYAAEEDFGIVPIEAQSCGTPVIGYERGALKETIVDIKKPKATGVLFKDQSIESIIDSVKKFEKEKENILYLNCRENALRFETKRFVSEFKEYIDLEFSHFSKR